MAKVLPFARKPDRDNPRLDVCLAKGMEKRHYLISPVTPSTWESRIEQEDGRAERCLLSTSQALRRKAELELRIATELGAGWTLERNQ